MKDLGFKLATTEPLSGKSYIEVYPHTALLRLMKAKRRVPYKQSKRSKYWKDLTTKQRKQKLLNKWGSIVKALEREVGPIEIPIDDTISLKPVEDALDAIICAWVGYKYATDHAESLGDEDAAIWTPVDGGDK